jgi:hypothetical protein
MSVYKKLMMSRIDLQGVKLKKSGLNKFAGYSYFELGDFLPEIQSIFYKHGLCGVVSYTAEVASLTITDVEDNTSIVITSPMAEANLKGTHPIQNLGAVETYQRRYLWMTAMEIVEHDVLDATSGSEAPAPKAKPAVRPVAAAAPEAMQGKSDGTPSDGAWFIKVETKPGTDVKMWVSLVITTTHVALEQAQNETDVMSIFKVNRNIYDHLKVVAAEDYDSLMGDFKSARTKFKDQA